MDRVTQLAELAAHADEFLILEKEYGLDPVSARRATRGALEVIAASLGVPVLEISAAIDTALGGR